MRSLVIVLTVAACWRGGSSPPPPPPPPENHTPAAHKPTGWAKLIRRVPGGGVIALLGERDVAMDAALEQMTEHCGPQSFTIVQEGEEAIATDETGQITTQWRVHYQCNSNAP